MESPARVPVTLVTGALGAGKSTLLRHILSAKHGHRIAVIENEFSAGGGIESLVLKDGVEGSVADGFVELNNGCICCTLKDSLVTTLEKLMEMRSKFDHILVETSGLADPGPVASIFWSDLGDESSLCLDGIVAVVDAVHVAAQLRESARSASAGGYVDVVSSQIAHADVVLMNKCDLAGASDLRRALSLVASVSPAARIVQTTRCSADVSALLNIGAFEMREKLPCLASVHQLGPSRNGVCTQADSVMTTTTACAACRATEPASSTGAALACAHGDGAHTLGGQVAAECSSDQQQHSSDEHGNSIGDRHQHTGHDHNDHAHSGHDHDPGIRSVLLSTRRRVNLDAFREWVGRLLWESEGTADDDENELSRTISSDDGDDDVDGDGGGGPPTLVAETAADAVVVDSAAAASQTVSAPAALVALLNTETSTHPLAPPAPPPPAPPPSSQQQCAVFRGKGVLYDAHGTRYIFQSVYALFDLQPATGAAAVSHADGAAGEREESRVLFIGRGLQQGELQAGLNGCCGCCSDNDDEK